MVPRSLRFWFVVHFVVDFTFGLPMIFIPIGLMKFLGFENPDPFTARLVGAALLGIGIESLLGWDSSLEVFRAMLNLKIIWSLAAIAGIMFTLFFDGGPLAAYAVLAIFTGFSGLWMYYRFLLR